MQDNKPYPQLHKLPAKSLEALGLEAPKPVEAIARTMASNLAQHAVSQEAQAMPNEGAPLPAQMPMSMPPADATAKPSTTEVAHQMEYANHGGPSRLHELLTPSQAQALGACPF